MLEGGRVQHLREEDGEHRLVEEGAAGCLEQEGQGEKEEEDINKMTETGAGGGHERVQGVREGDAGGREESLGGEDGQEEMTGSVTLSVRETVSQLEVGINF